MKYILPVLATLLLSIAACKKDDATEENNIRFCPNIYAQYSYENNGDTAYCWVPNVFTPGLNGEGSGDGANDLFNVYGYNLDWSSGNVTVKDGNTIVFYSDTIYKRWNGLVNGQTAIQKNYDYIVNGVDIYGNAFALSGTVSLLDSIGMIGSEWINGKVNCDSCRFPAQWDGRLYDPTLPTNEFMVDYCEEY